MTPASARSLLRSTLRVALAVMCIQFTACGGDATSHDTTSASSAPVGDTAADPSASAPARPADGRPAPRSLRFGRRPIVLLWTNGDGARAFEIYFRMTRRLGTSERVIVRLEGISDYDTTGTGYDQFAAPSCYAADNANRRHWPPPLLNARAGDPLRVTIEVPKRRAKVTATTPLQLARPTDPAPGAASSFWFRRLDCRPAEGASG